jgi:hypothetical protein
VSFVIYILKNEAFFVALQEMPSSIAFFLISFISLLSTGYLVIFVIKGNVIEGGQHDFNKHYYSCR